MEHEKHSNRKPKAEFSVPAVLAHIRRLDPKEQHMGSGFVVCGEIFAWGGFHLGLQHIDIAKFRHGTKKHPWSVFVNPEIDYAVTSFAPPAPTLTPSQARVALV
jgi:hypothetical protein